jgi:hypothetical protein
MRWRWIVGEMEAERVGGALARVRTGRLVWRPGPPQGWPTFMTRPGTYMEDGEILIVQLRRHFDIPRGQRMLSRYLGPDESTWDSRFRRYLHDDPGERGTIWIWLKPASLTAKDLSYTTGE